MTRLARRLLPLLLLCAPALGAAPLQFASPAQRATLLELYTSEGCSSCPPADRWLSTLRDDPRLWRELVPVAFHVDYWDYIGWPDRFADAAYSGRQRAYASSGRVGTVYTPGFVVDGREWRGWFRGGDPEVGGGATVGVLALEVEDQRVTARYAPEGEAQGRGGLELHVVTLGFGLRSAVDAGENAGRELRHDFVVLDYQRTSLAGRDGASRQTELALERPDAGAERYAVAAWVTPRGAPEPLQAAGGWLTPAP